MSAQKSFVLIGGSYGIGASLGDILLKQGHDVTVLSRTKPEQSNVKHVLFDVATDSTGAGTSYSAAGRC